MDTTTWGKQLPDGIEVEDIVAVEPTDLDWDRRFNPGYGGAEGVPFVAWTEDKVIFCVVYDGAEWLSTVPRNPGPCNPEHHGGQ